MVWSLMLGYNLQWIISGEMAKFCWSKGEIMTRFNRLVVILLWLVLLGVLGYFAAVPVLALAQTQELLKSFSAMLAEWQLADPTNFMIGQIASGVVILSFFSTLIWLEVLAGRRRGVRIRTAEGGSVELETGSIGRRLEWHLDQLAEINTVIPAVKSRGGSVDIRLEIEAAPDIDIPMKTDEVVEATREIIEQELGLRLGKLDVHMRCAPFEPEWA